MARKMALNFSKLCILILVGTVAYNEYVVYYMDYFNWPRVPDDACTILFLADPQIQGKTLEPPGLLGSIQRWDSDRYLGNVYSWITSKYPSATTVFLGDLLDEGSIATSEDFAEYAARFKAIFPSDRVKGVVYTPGDNDIGGEGMDMVTVAKLDRYNKQFGLQKPVIEACPKLDIVPVSRLTEHGHLNITSKLENLSKNRTAVVISHLPILPLNGRFAERVMTDINPDIIFSGHDHRGSVYTGTRGSLKHEREMSFFSKKEDISPFMVDVKSKNSDGVLELSERITEIVVPTLSYRMGVKEMGAGLAVFKPETGSMVYHNLWLPARFPLLYTYVASVIVVVLLAVVGKIIDVRRIMRRRTEYQAFSRKKFGALL
eukprot:TRINITY_DN8847_c0_g1_i1.p1 TRINITY_DN8847_c0_g1~~TRINITY_DN8847_c0_g1_i1.p1  ORF type:complete len:374 (+),score=50.80 TRINITY_DN8847_c0_g1_i1:88-1209(+)